MSDATNRADALIADLRKRVQELEVGQGTMTERSEYWRKYADRLHAKLMRLSMDLKAIGDYYETGKPNEILRRLLQRSLEDERHVEHER